MKSHLAIFDLDGTLTATNRVDSDCFVQAIEEEFGFQVHSDWSSYQHCTDAGIATESLTTHFGWPPSPTQIARLQSRFDKLLRSRLEVEPHLFRQVPGAAELLAHLRNAGWHTCIATGAWSFSADLKRQAAGLPSEVPLFSCDLHHAREVIVTTAIQSSLRACGVNRFTSQVSVGDGVWDVTTAAELGLPFVGVASADHAQRLLNAGAHYVVADFQDIGAIHALLVSAHVPTPTGGRSVG